MTQSFHQAKTILSNDDFDEIHTFDLPCVGNGITTAHPITIRLANEAGERNRANMLISRKYERRGFGADHVLPMAENCVSFTASSGPETIGTLSLTVDSPAGLQTDKTYGDHLAALRKNDGALLCELTKLAFDVKGQSLPILASLFHLIFIYGTQRFRCTDLVIEVVSRHRRFYETMLNFHCIDTPRMNNLVGFETQLMRLKVADIRAHIDENVGKNSVRSLYPFFFSADEEIGIYQRMIRDQSAPAVPVWNLPGAPMSGFGAAA